MRKHILETLEKVADYTEYALNTDNYVPPTKTINSGCKGNAFEYAGKLALGNYRFKGIAKSGHCDTSKKINGSKVTFEFKTGCGELAVVDELGKIKRTCLNNDYVVYCPIFEPTMDIRSQAYVLTADEFFKVITDCGLIRRKKSSQMTKRPYEVQYYDRIAIQSFKHNKKKMAMLDELLAMDGQLFGEWLAENLGQ